MKGFKAFLLRGNVLDLAVAVVIGAALTTVINAFVTGVINPLVGALGTSDLNSYRSCLRGPCSIDAAGKVTGIYIQWGLVLGALLQFLITAAVVYFCIVLPAGKMLERYMARRKIEKAAEVNEVGLLTEIRDLLARQG